jgi:hypothetical protein
LLNVEKTVEPRFENNLSCDEKKRTWQICADEVGLKAAEEKVKIIEAFTTLVSNNLKTIKGTSRNIPKTQPHLQYQIISLLDGRLIINFQWCFMSKTSKTPKSYLRKKKWSPKFPDVGFKRHILNVSHWEKQSIKISYLLQCYYTKIPLMFFY